MRIRSLRVLFLTLIFLAAIEIGLEVRATMRGWSTLILGAPEEAQNVENPDYGRTPGFPFRSRIVSVEKVPRTVRIWVSSASYAEDSSLPPDVIFPTLVEEEFDSAHVPAQVLNAARAGYTIDANIRQLNELGPVWRPDVVILYQMSLDVNVLSERYLSGPSQRKDVRTPAQRAGKVAAAGRRALQRWSENTTTYQLLHNNLTSRVLGEQLLADRLTPAAESEFRQRLNEFVDDVEALKATPVLCTFATSYDEDTLDQMPTATKLFLFSYNAYLSPRGWVREIERLNEILREVAAEREVPLVDVASRLTGHPELFKDFVHFTPGGHRYVAETIARTLLSHSSPHRLAFSIPSVP